MSDEEPFPDERFIDCLFCHRTVKLVLVKRPPRWYYVEAGYAESFKDHKCVTIESPKREGEPRTPGPLLPLTLPGLF